MSREQMQGKQERGKSDVPEKVVVAVKASKEIPKSALVWALTHVVQPGDSITLLAVVLSQSSGRRFWGFGRWGCASHHNSGATLDQRSDITDSCSQMFRQLHGVYDPNKVSIKIRIVSGSPCGAVAAETKKVQANWVVLDKHLKHEEKRCMDELQCNIVVMKRSKPKVLRLNLVGRSKETEVASPLGKDKCPVEHTDNNNNSSESMQGQVVTPTSSPELGTPFTATTEAGTSSASSDPGGSPFFISETTGNLKKDDLFVVKESMDVNEYSSDSESEAPSAAPSRRFEPCVESFLSLHCQSSRCIEEESEISRIEEGSETSKTEGGSEISKSVEQPPMTKVLQERFAKFDRQNCRSDLELNGTVRDAVSLSRNVPPGPPPLCSICQHKAPVFGNPPRWFSYADLELATCGFSQVNFLAEGGYGSVHRGVLPDGQVIAVKQHKLASSQGDIEFCSEVEVLSRAQHRNVVMLIGFCIEDKRRLLVYEYICNGSLDSHLYGHHQEPLEWPSRQKVAVGAARGLRYLHEECRVGCIIHRDMRPNNILVTHDFEPLVGDFGLARWQPDGEAGVETRVIGTFGYLAPEYAESGQITEKADVYSFGVVLVELVTGRKAVDLNRPKGQQCLTEWARPLLEAHAINELIDPRLGNRYSEQEVHCMLQAASLCIRRDPQTRPRMSQVLRILEGDMIMDSNFMPTPGSDVGNRSGRMQAEPLMQDQHYANPLWNEEASEEAFSNNVPPSSPALVEEDTVVESSCQLLLINQEP